LVLAAIWTTRPSPATNSMSSGIKVFFIHIAAAIGASHTNSIA
jgi:hypothetical protein